MIELRPSRLPASVATLALLLVFVLLACPAGAAAQQAAIDPREVALTTAELPPGFVVTRDESRAIPGDVGVLLERHFERPVTSADALSGPVSVAQLVARIDRLLVPADVLAELGNRLARDQGLTPAPDGPNDRERISLVKQEGPSVAYVYGFVKGNMVILTLWGGLTGTVDLPGLIGLAGVSAAKYDAIVAASGPAPQPAGPAGNCAFVKGGGPTIYVVEGGKKRPIPDWDTYVRLGGAADLSNVCNLSDDQLNAMP